MQEISPDAENQNVKCRLVYSGRLPRLCPSSSQAEWVSGLTTHFRTKELIHGGGETTHHLQGLFSLQENHCQGFVDSLWMTLVTNNKWPPPGSAPQHPSPARAAGLYWANCYLRKLEWWGQEMALITDVAIGLKIWQNCGSGAQNTVHNRAVLVFAVGNSAVKNQIPVEGVKKPGKIPRGLLWRYAGATARTF